MNEWHKSDSIRRHGNVGIQIAIIDSLVPESPEERVNFQVKSEFYLARINRRGILGR